MMPLEYTDTIKRSVTARDVATRYGLPFNRSGFACCPFHGEKTASMKLYDQQGKDGFYCFGCHVGGSVIDLAMKLLGTDFAGAIRQLDSDFGLGLQLDRELSPAERRAARQVKAERIRQANTRAEKQREIEAILDDLARRYLFLLKLADNHRPTRNNPDFDEQWCYAMEELPEAKDQYERAEYERQTLCQKTT